MASPEHHKRPISLALPPDVIERLEAMADRLGISRSDAGTRALRAGLDFQEGVLDSPVGRSLLRVAEVLGDPELADELTRIRKHIESRKRQKPLPGLEL